MELNCKIFQDVQGIGNFTLKGGLQKIVENYPNISFFPSGQQYNFNCLLNLKNLDTNDVEIEIGIEEKLSNLNFIPLIYTRLSVGEIKTFNINQDLFFRALKMNHPDFYYKFYYNSTGLVRVKGIVSLKKLNEFLIGVPY